MRKILLTLCVAGVSAFGQYKLESAGPPPADLAPALRDAVAKDGARVSGASGPFCEVWWRTSVPKTANSETNVSFTDIRHGTLLGVIRFPGKGADRRSQPLKPGLYTMRLSFFPVTGAHQGVSQTRDFVLLTPAADDTDANATPDFPQLLAMTRKASGTGHPAVLNVWKADSAGPPKLEQQGDDWVLSGTAGDRPISMIVVGAFGG